MPLQPLRLDDRDFESLFKEARSRIPRYVPEWTDWNDSDPGITLLQLQAWLAETILFRLNQLPDLNFIKFLQLLGVEQRPAKPAQANLTFILKDKVATRLSEVLIERRTVVGVSARDLEEPLYFETDRTLRAISAELEVLVHVPDINVAADGTAPVLVTEDNNFAGRTFTPFTLPTAGDTTSPSAVNNTALLLGFKSPLPFSREEIGLQFYLAEEGQALLAPAPQEECTPQRQVDRLLRWECWDGTTWSDLDITGDETLNLTRSGQVFFKVPVQIPSVSYESLLGELKSAKVDDTLYYWLRIVMDQADAYDKAPEIDRVLTNVVSATAALTVFDEAVGSSDGNPNQVMPLRHAPVLAEPKLVLEVDEGSGPKPWKQVSDFYGAKPDSAVYTLNRTTGEITFGDGLRGRIPVAGQFNVIAREYRYGGGRVGNVGAETITDLATPIADVDSVTNYRPAEGGADEETLDETKLRGPRDALKTRNRAVTLEDFALLAAETPGALVARAHAYVAKPSSDGNGCGRVINVVIVPSSEDAKPVPSEVALDMVCRYLNERRLITTQVCVQGPPYHDVDVALDVRARDNADLKTVKNAIADRLEEYFHPLKGGEDKKGWPFGRDIYYSELLREIMVLPGVLRVESLTLYKLLKRFDTKSDADGEMNGLIEAEGAAFPDACWGEGPDGVVIAIVESPQPGDPPVQRWYVAAAYDCCDLPVADGALIALRQANISISYARSRGV